jgi:hypothetical protein
MATRSTAAERAEWTANLRETLPPGSTAYTVLRHVSASGMTRDIDVYAFAPGDTPDHPTKFWLSYRVAAILGESYNDRREAVRVGGAGMDMGFHIVYRLSHALYPDGFACIGDRCPSNDHTNGRARAHEFPTTYGGQPVGRFSPCPIYDRGNEGDRCGLGRSKHPTAAMWHRDGGYAISQEWI